MPNDGPPVGEPAACGAQPAADAGGPSRRKIADGTSAAMPRQDAAGRWRTLVLAGCLMATFMAAVESSIVATTLPTIVADLGGFNVFSWVFTIYLLTQAVSIPVYGRLADLYGRKPIIFVGTGLFLSGTTLCGFAWDMPSLICFRALEGIGAGAIQPIAATILGDIYTPTERGRVQGLVSSVFGIAAVIGPSMGAFLIQYVSWRVVFWVNVPIGLTAIAMLAVFLKENVAPRQHRIDWLGSLLLLIACGALMLALVQAGHLERPVLVGLTAAGVVALALLFLHERTTAEPMLPLELWRGNRIVVVGSLGSCFAGAVMMGISAFLPAYVQGAMGHTALAGGLVLGAMSVSWAVASIVGARLMARLPRGQRLGGGGAGQRLRDAGGAAAGARAVGGQHRLLRHRHRHGVLQHGVHRVDPGLGAVAPARRGDVVEHVPALRRPSGWRGGLRGGAECDDAAT
jgi:EmrB/QacA subfamily drug resistance transporter